MFCSFIPRLIHLCFNIFVSFNDGYGGAEYVLEVIIHDQIFVIVPVKLTKDVVKGFAYDSGVYASSCLNYRNATYPYTYNDEGSGLFQIKPRSIVMTVYCDMDTDGGGWTLFAGIKRDYWGDQFHVFDDANALASASATSFHIQTTDLLAISKEIKLS